jgi:hypothetical protein
MNNRLENLPSPRLPGALTINPLVQKMSSAEGMSVSDSALWLLVVAAREYTTLVLKSAVADVASICPETGKNAKKLKSKKRNSTTNRGTPPKRRVITALDLAQVLARNQKLGGGTVSSRLAVERCIANAGVGVQIEPPSGLGAIQGRLLECSCYCLIRRTTMAFQHLGIIHVDTWGYVVSKMRNQEV